MNDKSKRGKKTVEGKNGVPKGNKKTLNEDDYNDEKIRELNNEDKRERKKTLAEYE